MLLCTMPGRQASPRIVLPDDQWHQAFPCLFFQEQRLFIIPHAHSAQQTTTQKTEKGERETI